MPIIIRAQSFHAWMQHNFTAKQLRHIRQYGIDWSGGPLTNNQNTAKLYDRFKEEIWACLFRDAEDAGLTIFQWLAQQFGHHLLVDVRQVEQLMVWHLAEKIAVAQDPELTDD